MFIRTVSSSVTFLHPFTLAGCDGVQPPGTYAVETDEEVIQTASVRACRRILTLMRFPAGADVAGTRQIIAIDAAELADALTRDAQSAAAVAAPPLPSDGEGAPTTDAAAPTMIVPNSIRRDRWNAKRLMWSVLVFGGVWFAGILTNS